MNSDTNDLRETRILEKENELLKKQIYLDSIKNEISNKNDGVKISTELQATNTENSKNAEPIRLGKHLISLQWITSEQTPNGSVNITKVDNITYKIEGGQESLENSDYVHINGTFTLNGVKELLFDGTLIYKVEHNNSGLPCDKSGRLLFKATSNRKYWRMQQMQNCEGGMLTDYVDIYF